MIELPTESEPVAVIRGDTLDVMRTLPDESFDVVITSPPYNLGTTTGGGFPDIAHYPADATLGRRGGQGKWAAAAKPGGLAHGYSDSTDAMPMEDYVAWQKECLTEMWRLIGPTGAIFYNHKPRVLAGRLLTPFEYNPGLPVRQIVIWARAGGINFAPTHYVPTHEWVMIFAKDRFRLKSKGASGVGDVWSITQEPNPLHPAPFPVELPRRILSTIKARRCLDPFCGSGTVGVACVGAGVEFVGIDKSERYVGVARQRINDALGVGGLWCPKAPAAGVFDDLDPTN